MEKIVFCMNLAQHLYPIILAIPPHGDRRTGKFCICKLKSTRVRDGTESRLPKVLRFPPPHWPPMPRFSQDKLVVRGEIFTHESLTQPMAGPIESTVGMSNFFQIIRIQECEEEMYFAQNNLMKMYSSCPIRNEGQI